VEGCGPKRGAPMLRIRSNRLVFLLEHVAGTLRLRLHHLFAAPSPPPEHRCRRRQC